MWNFRGRTAQRCEQVRERVSLDLDGELSGFERVLVDRHLASCAGCKAFAAQAGSFTQRLRAAPLVELERPVSVPARRSFRLETMRFAAAAAAAAAALAVGVGALTASLGESGDVTRAVATLDLAIDVNQGLMKARQRSELEKRLEPMLPRPAGAQPVV